MITITHTQLRQATSLVISFTGMFLGVSLGIYMTVNGTPTWLASLCGIGIMLFGLIVPTFLFCELDARADGWGAVNIGNRTLVFLATLGSCGLLVVLWSVGCMVLFGVVFTVIVALCLLMLAISICDVAVALFRTLFVRAEVEEADE
jgi:hypothetical protein